MEHMARRRNWVLSFLMIAFCITPFFPCPVAAADTHDIHISVCELRWNEESGVFEVSIKIFIDDLELALTKMGAPGLFIGTPKEDPYANDFIADYLRKHLTITIEHEKLIPVFLGKELSDDFQAEWCYIEIPAEVSRGQKCTLSNDVLMELYDDQRNIMDIRMHKSHKEYTIFQPDRSSWSYTF